MATTIYIGIDLTQILKSNNIKNERFFIQFQNRLVLEIYNLEIPKIESSSKRDSKPPKIEDILEYIRYFQMAVEKIDIRNLKVPNYFSGDILYQNGYIQIETEKNILKTDLHLEKSKLYLDIHKIYIPEYSIDISGDLLFNAEDNETVFFSKISLKNEINISVAGRVDNFQHIYIRADSEKIRDLKTIFDILKLPKTAYIWGIDRAKYRYIKLNKISTNFAISNPKIALKNLVVNGEVRDLNYIFEPKLKPVQSDSIKISIQNGNLYLELRSLKYGENIFQNSIKIGDLYSKPHLFVEIASKVSLDNTLENTIKYYSKLQDIPVSISGKLDTEFFMDMKLYDSLAMRFLADIEISDSEPISKTIPNIESGNIRFRFPENILEIEKTKFSFQKITDGEVTGEFDVPNSNLDFNVILNKIKIDENSSMKSETLKLNISGNIDNITTNISKSNWSFVNIETNLSNFEVNYFQNRVKISKLNTDVNEFNLSTNLNGVYDIENNKADLDLRIENLKFSELNISKENFKIFADIKKDIQVKIPKLQTEVNISNLIYLDFGEVGLFRNYLPIAQKYPKISGEVQVILDKNISIDGKLNMKQKVLKDGNRFIEDFNFSGTILGEDMKISVNDKIFIDKSAKIDILIDDYDFNITGLNDFIDMNSSKEPKKNDENFSMNIEQEINLYLNGTSIYLTDMNNSFNSKSIFLTIFGDKIYLKTELLDRGTITVETKNDRYIVKAVNLGEPFIASLSNFHGISGGDYNLYIKGIKEDFRGLLQFRKLKVKNMDLVNNILAFINTVPALLTFSRPGFNHNGLRILAGYIDFEKIGDRIYFRDIQIKGESIDFSGKGYIDIANNKISMQIDISAIKYIDKFIENIPIANYLILGDDGSITTRIVIRGNLDDPKISSQIHKDIFYTPLELTKRVFNLPTKMLEVLKDLNFNDKQNQDNVRDFLKNIGF